MRSLGCLLVVLTAGCGGAIDPSSREECQGEYAVPAASTLGAKHAYALCEELFRESTPDHRRELALCALPGLRDAGSDTGARIAVKACHEQHPAPRSEPSPTDPSLSYNPFFDYPNDTLIEADFDLAKQLGIDIGALKLKVAESLPNPKDQAWGVRHELFLSLPRNQFIRQDETIFRAWRTQVAEVAAEPDFKAINHYWLMDLARDRVAPN